MRIELKVLDERLHAWGLPRCQSAGAAAIDLHACLEAPAEIAPGAPPLLIPAGFALHINDPGIAALILPRSGLGHKAGLILGNGTGLIDPDYQGPILVSAWNRGIAPVRLAPGDRFAQLLFVPILRPELVPVAAFSSETARGQGGFGSTGPA